MSSWMQLNTFRLHSHQFLVLNCILKQNNPDIDKSCDTFSEMISVHANMPDQVYDMTIHVHWAVQVLVLTRSRLRKY